MKKGYKVLIDLDCRYAVNEQGNLISFFGPHGLRDAPLELAGKPDAQGYVKISVTKDNGVKLRTSIHRLVGAAFLGLSLKNRNIVVNHKDGDKLNNHVSNLELCTRKQNSRHAARAGLFGVGKIRKFSEEQKEILISRESFEEIKRQFSM